MASKPLPSYELLHSLLRYDEHSGNLHWKQRVNQGVHAGDIAGRPNKCQRYLRVKIDGVAYVAHRLIWKMQTGADPIDVIDHIDCNPFNNRWLNLREADAFLNMRNRPIQKNNTSGVKGVKWVKSDKRWSAYITSGEGQKYLGYFSCLGQAAKVVKEARAQLHGEFARAR